MFGSPRWHIYRRIQLETKTAGAFQPLCRIIGAPFVLVTVVNVNVYVYVRTVDRKKEKTHHTLEW